MSSIGEWTFIVGEAYALHGVANIPLYWSRSVFLEHTFAHYYITTSGVISDWYFIEVSNLFGVAWYVITRSRSLHISGSYFFFLVGTSGSLTQTLNEAFHLHGVASCYLPLVEESSS